MGRERQIHHVAAGRISRVSTDAVNGSQLAATNNMLARLNEYNQQKFTLLDKAMSDHSTKIAEKQVVKGHAQDIADNKGAINDNANNIIANLNTITDHEEKINSHSIAIKKQQTLKTNLINNVSTLQESTKKNTESIAIQAENIKTNTADITANREKINEHSYSIGELQTNVAEHADQISDLNTGLNRLGNKVSDLDTRLNKVGAGAAALAALHPLDYDPAAKWDVAAGLGNYKGKKALALGTFFRPTENVMISLGATVGNGENLANLGVSFKLDGTKTPRSKNAMAREIVDLRTQLAALSAKVNSMSK